MSGEIVFPSEPSAAIDLFARAVAHSIDATVSSSDAESPDRFLMTLAGATLNLSLDLRGLSVRVEKRGTVLGEIPYSLGESAAPRAQRLRVLFAGGAASDRRLRMTSKVIAEARARGIGCELIVVGPVPPDWSRAVAPEQQFGDLTAQETFNLVRAARCVLECGDGPETPTELALIATAAGVPVVVHRSSAIAALRPDCVVAVDEWSADAFVDAIASPRRDVAPFAIDPGAELLRILERARA